MLESQALAGRARKPAQDLVSICQQPRIVPDEPDEVPNTVNVVGRAIGRENADLVGEYHRVGTYHGRPVYRKPATKTFIRYFTPAERWLIDRSGLQESDVCCVYSEQGGSPHPAYEELVWRVWETSHGQHVRDPDFLVTAAPAAVQVVGRAAKMENWSMNGEYRLIGLHCGRVAYRKVGTHHAIRYFVQGNRWLIDLDGLRDSDVCNAFADAGESDETLGSRLVWNVWDSMRGRHVPDPCLQTLHVPRRIELVGRDPPKENVQMNGTYYIVGLHAGRPAYQKVDGTRHAIRYWPREDRWLVDLDGLRDVDICNGYAEADGGLHPGDRALYWHIWETSRARHLGDPEVRTLDAPHSVLVSGRDPYKENSSLNGEYVIDRFVEGLPAYRKPGTRHIIRYWPSEDRWLIDLKDDVHGGDVANAYADARGAQHPGYMELQWYVWESALRRHMLDEELLVEAVEPMGVYHPLKEADEIDSYRGPYPGKALLEAASPLSS